MSAKSDEFRDRVQNLVNQVRGWVEPQEWVTKPYPKRMRDDQDQKFEVPSLFLQKGPTRVLLDPVAYDVPGSDGVVDLYLMPTYDDLASLYLEQGDWRIHYEFPADNGAESGPKSLPLSQESINQVLDSIAAHAEPSF